MKKFFWYAVIPLLLAAGSVQGAKPEHSAKIDDILETGRNYLGKPYRYRADSGYQFDCSGFVSHVLLQHDIRLPRSSRDMIHAVRKVASDDLQKGDLLFFKGRNASSKTIGHVAMVVDPTPGALKMIHATSRGIVIDPYPTPFYARRYVSAGRIPELDTEGAFAVGGGSSGEPEKSILLKTDTLIDRIEQSNRGMGAVSVFKHGKPVYQRQYGLSSIELQRKNDELTLFRIGSVSKTFTATILFKLMEEGKLSLTDSLGKWFPLFGNARTITIQHMLTHQSGLYNFTNDPSYLEWNTREWSRKDLVSKMLLYPNKFMPGTQTEYSNTNYVLLSWIAEDASGESYPELLKRIITGPCGLTHTFSCADSTMKVADSYTLKKEWERVEPTHESIPLGAGALVSTPADLNRFIYALFTGQLISEQSLKTMTTINNGIGMGIFKVPFYEKEALGHTGGIDGFQSQLFYFPADSVSIALTANAVLYPLNELSKGVLSDVYHKAFDLPVFNQILYLSPEELKKYEGVYSAAGLPINLTIREKDGILTGQGTGQPSFPLSCTAPHRFSFEQAGITLEFNLTKKQMVLIQMGNRFVMTKEEGGN